jgi:hypothetical protein
MESEKTNSNKINRKKFFSSLGTGVISYFVFKAIPFSFLAKRKENKNVIIEINPDAVSRTKIGGKNV